jgi:glutamate-5-semialdehyde dehydrogenase
MSTSTEKLAATESVTGSVAEIARRARTASRALARLSHTIRNEVLMAAAQAIEDAAPQIRDANQKDCRAAEPAVTAGKMSAALFKRLCVGEHGVEEMAAKVREVAKLPDPIGRVLSEMELDDGLVLRRETCPLGVIGFVFEARPEVISEIGSLALKSANAVILKGGTEAANTNEVLIGVWRDCLRKFPSVPPDSIQLLRTRADVGELLAVERDIDLIIPRGSREFVEYVMRNSRAPVLGHGEGICHVYVDSAADLSKAVEITFDAKVQNPAPCNAAETLLVHEAIAKDFLSAIAARLKEAGVEIRGCPRTVALLGKETVAATEKDWATEYCDLVISIKIVDSLDAAIEHINRYGSRHTDTIVTEDSGAARQFMEEVDSAGVFQNASTRLSDGFIFGLGAEVGISNGKLHARGPMGLEGLTTYKWKLFGTGQTRAEYAKGIKQLKHRPIQ